MSAMITGKSIYDVLAAMVPLYVAMILAYGSVKWWKLFTPDQCAGINRFVAVFAVPLLGFQFISTNNIYQMNFKFIAADSLQKVVILGALFLWQSFSKSGSLEWMITLFSLSTLPNTLIIGIPLLTAMYGDISRNLIVQVVMMQAVFWNTVLLFMFEYRGAKLIINEQFPDTAASITSFKVESDVISLNGREPLEADAEAGEDGKLHVVVRRSSASSMMSSYNKGLYSDMITPTASNLTGVEIYSVQSSCELTPRVSSFSQTDLYPMSKSASSKHGYRNSFGGSMDVYSFQSLNRSTSRTSNFEEEMMKTAIKREGRSKSEELFKNGVPPSYPSPNLRFSASLDGHKRRESGGGGSMPNKDLNMSVGSSSSFPVFEPNFSNAANLASSTELGSADATKDAPLHGEMSQAATKIYQDMVIEIESASKYAASAALYPRQKKSDLEESDDVRKYQMPPASVMTRLILIMVWRKLTRNPNTYSSLFGLIWSLVSFRWHIEMPTLVKGSISILSDAGLGMAMFSLGLFIALQPKIIACRKSVASLSMLARFLIGPAVIAATSLAIGLRGVLLHVSIIQTALPQGIVPFVFAKEYNVHPGILSTAVIFSMVLALPITILYYLLLAV